jgi:hypothetical protein
MILRNEEECMSKGKHSEPEMIGALKQLEAGRTAANIARELGVSKHTIYAWKAKYGGPGVNVAQGERRRFSMPVFFFASTKGENGGRRHM